MRIEAETVRLLTDLSIVSGQRIFCTDAQLQQILWDTATGIPGADVNCPGCSLGRPMECRPYWKRIPSENGLIQCPDGRGFVCATLQNSIAPCGIILTGPLQPGVVTGERRVGALQTLLESASCLLERRGLLPQTSEEFVKLSTYVAEHLSEDLTMESLQSVLYISASAISRLVKREAGLPLRLYIQRKRLETARVMLLNTTMAVSQIAERCGITDSNYFSRIFRQQFNLSPTAMRNGRGIQMPAQPPE